MPAAAFDHGRRKGTSHVEQAFYIGVQHGVPIVGIAFLDGVAPQCQTGVVDQDIDLPTSTYQFFRGAVHTGAVADIKGKAVLVGNFSAFAIWSEGRYASRESADQRNIFDAMRELGL